MVATIDGYPQARHERAVDCSGRQSAAEADEDEGGCSNPCLGRKAHCDGCERDCA